MTHRYAYNALDRTLRDIRQAPDLVFGGIPTVFGGDFAQILPVVPGGTELDVVAANIQRSPLWGHFRRLFLRQNMRLQEGQANIDFSLWLKDMPYNQEPHGDLMLPPEVQRLFREDDLIEFVWPENLLQNSCARPQDLGNRAILALTNESVRRFNAKVLARFFELTSDQCPQNFYAVDVPKSDNNMGLPIETYNNQTPAGFPPHKLELKPGVPVMCLRNVNPAIGLVNGTRLMVTNVGQHYIRARIIGSSFDGNILFIPRIIFETDEDFFLEFQRKQFPLRVSYAITVNKSQGQSLTRVGVDLTNNAFSHGQLYVALSRVTNVAFLRVLLGEGSEGMTKNVVSRQALLLP